MSNLYNYNTMAVERRAKLETLTAIAKTLELKNPYTEKHSQDMINNAVKIAIKLDVPLNLLDNIKYGAILHDIGKLATPDAILNKKGKLTEEEFAEIKKHPLVGYELLKNIFEPISDMIKSHHERVDGKGYPSGLKGDDITLPAKIIAVCDVYDALISERPYKEPISKNKAISIIEENTGTHFDSEVVKAFLAVM